MHLLISVGIISFKNDFPEYASTKFILISESPWFSRGIKGILKLVK